MTWDRATKDYNDILRPISSEFAREALKMLTFTDHGSVFLDIASGPGTLAILVAKHLNDNNINGKVISSDSSQLMINQARDNFNAKSDLQGIWEVRLVDACNLSFEPGSMSHIGCIFGLTYVPSVDKAFLEIYRVLKPGGQAVFANWIYNDRFELIKLFAISISETRSVSDLIDWGLWGKFDLARDTKRFTDLMQKQGLVLENSKEVELNVEITIEELARITIDHPLFQKIKLRLIEDGRDVFEVLHDFLSRKYHENSVKLRMVASIVLVYKT